MDDPFRTGHPCFLLLLPDPGVSPHALQYLLHFSHKFPQCLEAKGDLPRLLGLHSERGGEKAPSPCPEAGVAAAWP